MHTQCHTASHSKLSQRLARPPLFYHLGATSKVLSTITVLPEQFYSSPTSAYKAPGEVALMRAVLEDAVDCFQKQFVKSGRRGQRLAREAEEWLFTNDYHWPFSFVNICTVLGLDPEYIRLGLKCWRLLAKPQKEKGSMVPGPQPLKTAA